MPILSAATPSPTIVPRRILLTGGSSGIGFAAARLLLEQGHGLILPCRDAVTAEATVARLRAALGGARPGLPEPALSAPVADLADLSSVERCAAALLERGEPIDTLVLNAGLQDSGAPQPRRSAQGYELTIGVNHLAHQALALRLLPLLEAGRAPRLVVTASEVHDPTTPGGRVGPPAGLGDLEGLRSGPGFEMVAGGQPFQADKAYKDSKLCNMLFARELERRLRQRGTPLPVLALSPGLVIPRENGGFFRSSRRHNELGQRLFALVARDLLRVTATPAQAGALLARLATDPEEGSPGFRYRCNQVLGPGRLREALVEPSAEARDDALAERLWTISAGLVGLPPELSV